MTAPTTIADVDRRLTALTYIAGAAPSARVRAEVDDYLDLRLELRRATGQNSADGVEPGFEALPDSVAVEQAREAGATVSLAASHPKPKPEGGCPNSTDGFHWFDCGCKGASA